MVWGINSLLTQVPRRLFTIVLLFTLVVLITVMGWFSVRMYHTEKKNLLLAQQREHETNLELKLWQLETEALALFNTCLLELSGEGAVYVKARYLVDGKTDWSAPTKMDEELKRAALESSIRKEAEKGAKENDEYSSSLKKKALRQKSRSYEARNANILKQQKVTQDLIANSYEKVSVLSEVESNFSDAESNVTVYPALKLGLSERAVKIVEPISVNPRNFSPYIAGWVGGELYLLREHTVKGQIEAALVDQRKVEQELLKDHPEVVLNSSEYSYITTVEGGLKLLSVADLPFLEDTLLSLPYKVILPQMPAPRVGMDWFQAIAVIWAVLFLTVLLALVFIWSLQKLSKRRAQFVSSVTHELRTPLTSFQLYAEMLCEDLIPTQEKRNQYLDTLNREAKRLSHLVENVLTYSQIEKGRLQKIMSSFDDLWKPIEERLRERVSQTEASLKIKIAQGVPEQIVIDPTALEQILFNLVDNACKYGLGENPRQELLLEVASYREKICFALTDYGDGIAKKEKSKLFRPFHKSAEKAADTSKPGVGLGLSIARRQAKLLGGSLVLELPTEAGCRFVLQLPIK